MPKPAPFTANAPLQTLVQLGEQIRAHRKALHVSATVAAEAAGISRVTLHRIEQGNPSVTIGAYANALAVLGLEMGILANRPAEAESAREAQEGWIPARIPLADYPQLKQLAWQVHGTDTLTPLEALGIYERNARHLDLQALEPRERHLIDALRLALTDSRRDV
jgi:transcriptional regulator with XRE-family HTH domain